MMMRTGFVFGCGHRGTTLIATILASHPDVYLPFRRAGVEAGTAMGCGDG
ncbi:MAG: sulfotransferase [Mesorhizobium sp.]|nr:hypothetical protein [Mesorhizobium sp.]TIL76313.1 MAG: sulfotransferase [Mesorhizobium sp.]TIL93984.1 MAG: sulfotransferase [Mesorhizobium sp.]TIM02402.1 MAG: sulfotransferase [Mesorhizobium sp.]